MDEKRQIKVSKYLSKHLRHQPERLGLVLEPGGWVLVEDLLTACTNNRFPITRAELDAVVAGSDKKRFAFDETATRIRANQGHSVAVDLQLQPVEPPEILFHGTGHRSVELILAGGLQKMSRHHVHLSADMETAIKVGSRHGKPVVFQVASGEMHRQGHVFHCSANGVWLVEHVPVEFLHAKTQPTAEN